MFSIIIPFYNAEEYVDRALSSVVNQTLSKERYEIIAVNDASTDNTLNKLNSWQAGYPQLIRVISYEENLRQGGARNAGIRVARGEYLCFMDGDDWIEPDCLETYDAIAQYRDFDMIVSKHTESDSFELVYEESSESEKTVSLCGIYSREDDFAKIVSGDFGYFWCTAYKKSVVTDNDIYFPEKIAYEDIYWSRMIKLYAKDIAIADKITHHHYTNPESTMNKKGACHHLDRLISYEMLLEKCEKEGFLQRAYDEFLNDTVETYYLNSYYMFFTRMEEIPDVYLRIRNNIIRFFPDWEEKYNESDLPIYCKYMIILLRKAVNVKPEDMLTFKETLLEMV